MRFLSSLVFFLLICHGLTRELHAQGQAESWPTLDLSQQSFSGDHLYKITENWEVFWGQLLRPEQLQEKSTLVPELQPFQYMVPKPSSIEGRSSQVSAATYRLRLRLPEHAEPFTLSFSEIGAASEIWLNGAKVLTNGVVSLDPEKEEPSMRIAKINIAAGLRDLELVILVSGHNMKRMGMMGPLVVGPQLTMNDIHSRAMLRDTFVLGAILIMSFYHFALYFVRRKGIEPILFGLFCLSMSIMTLIRSEGRLAFLFIEHSYGLGLWRLEFFAFPLSSILMTIYTYKLYPNYLKPWLKNTMMSMALLYMFAIAFTPPPFFDNFLMVFQLVSVSAGILLIGFLVKAAMDKADGASLFLIGFALIMVGAINDSLRANGMLESIPISHMTLFGFILAQSIILSKRFSKAFTMLEVAEGEIRLLNSDLESKVQDRTATIRMILDNVRSGFLLIDRKLMIQSGFTKSCEEILQQEIAAGTAFGQLFPLNQRDRSALDMSLRQVFDDLMPESVSLSSVPSRLSLKKGQVALQCSVIRHETQGIQSMLLTLTDATHVAHMESEAKLSQSLVKILQAQVNFRSLLSESFHDLERAKDLLHEPGQASVKMILHTLKGNFSSFGLEDIVHAVHHLEDQAEASLVDIEGIIQIIHLFLDVHKDILKIDPAFPHQKSYRIHDHHFHGLGDRLKHHGATPALLSSYSDWLGEIKQVSFDELIGPIAKKARRLGENLGKNLLLTVEGGQLKIDSDRMQSLVHSLIHLVRNSVDHGLEFAKERGSKSELGQIHIRVQHLQNSLQIEVGDDGRGIDPKLVKSVAVERGIVSPLEAEQLSDDQALKLIFRVGFSTRSEVTSISGRGVGMSAIEAVVRELGGQIAIDTKLGCGTSVRITIPDIAMGKLQRKVG